MARKKAIPDDIREQVVARIDAFNKAHVRPNKPSPMSRLMRAMGMPAPEAGALPAGTYVPRFKGVFLYLDRVGFGGFPSEICRLRWTGSMEGWEFAIYRHSRNIYDPDEWFFPGAEDVDGTVEGAMRAGLKAYPD